eukprot:CAMPEP_0204328838 /NCGR_PEP_ID=MMETSP0469-20131031/13715_1 /ASSEMBLY_ACC=CAM_ASM_000384 /TAXON_ID=2969 /ORGANISM="Oxyrrhis marina" /LENGTH=38 /DNA_ID= /DNA_START= /DNA_END= /DNA_ORIENTATION=
MIATDKPTVTGPWMWDGTPKPWYKPRREKQDAPRSPIP